jgi:hypothetical protein
MLLIRWTYKRITEKECDEETTSLTHKDFIFEASCSHIIICSQCKKTKSNFH